MKTLASILMIAALAAPAYTQQQKAPAEAPGTPVEGSIIPGQYEKSPETNNHLFNLRLANEGTQCVSITLPATLEGREAFRVFMWNLDEAATNNYAVEVFGESRTYGGCIVPTMISTYRAKTPTAAPAVQPGYKARNIATIDIDFENNPGLKEKIIAAEARKAALAKTVPPAPLLGTGQTLVWNWQRR